MAKWRRPNFEEGTYGDIFPRNMGAMMRVEEIGNGKAVSTFFDNLDKTTRTSVYNSMVDWALIYKRSIKDTINNNGAGISPGWKPLNARYAAGKKYHKNQFYRYSDALYRAITMSKDKVNGRVIVTVDPDPSFKSYGSDNLSASQIAHILEMGTLHIPARPLFKPVWKMIGGNNALAKFTAKNLDLDIKIKANRAR